MISCMVVDSEKFIQYHTQFWLWPYEYHIPWVLVRSLLDYSRSQAFVTVSYAIWLNKLYALCIRCYTSGSWTILRADIIMFNMEISNRRSILLAVEFRRGKRLVILGLFYIWMTSVMFCSQFFADDTTLIIEGAIIKYSNVYISINSFRDNYHEYIHRVNFNDLLPTISIEQTYL